MGLFMDIKEVKKIFKDLFPMRRSITGIGNEKTIEYLNRNGAGLAKKYVDSGTVIFDWVVPDEWIFNDAYVKNAHGKKIIDCSQNILQLVNYSEAVHLRDVPKKSLLEKLHWSDKGDDLIPYRTSYYNKSWGFCCEKRLIESEDFVEPFEVRIDTEHKKNGKMVFAERVFPGAVKKNLFSLLTFVTQ